MSIAIGTIRSRYVHINHRKRVYDLVVEDTEACDGAASDGASRPLELRPPIQLGDVLQTVCEQAVRTGKLKLIKDDRMKS